MLYAIDLLLLLIASAVLSLLLWRRGNELNLARSAHALLFVLLLSLFARSCGLI